MKKQNQYYVEEREIDVKRMLVHALSYWRVILAAAAAGAVIFGASQYCRDVTAAKNSIQAQIDAANTPIATVESVAAQLTESEVQNVQSAVNYKIYAEERTQYMSESVYMNIDAYNENAVYLSYRISSEQPSAVLEQCADYLTGVALAQTLSDKLGLSIENKYLMELYQMSSNNGRETFTVKVCAGTAEECETLADGVNEALVSYVKGIAVGESANELILEEQISDVILDGTLLNLKSSYNAEIYSNTSAYNALYAAFNDTQKTLLQMLLEEKQQEGGVSIYAKEEGTEEVALSGDASAVDTTIRVRLSVKMILAGFFVGAVIAYAVCALGYTISKAVHGADEVKYLFGIPVFGTIRLASYRKRKKGGAVDTAVYRLNYGKNKFLDTERQMQMAVANLKIGCEKEEISEVYLTGSEPERIPAEWIRDLTERLKKENIRVTAGSSVLCDAQSVVQMAQCGNAVLVEVEEKSKCEEIAKELNLCIQNQIRVLGVILVHG